MTQHIMVNLDKIQAAHHGNIESVQASADMDNGSFVVLGDLVANERELYACAAATDVTTQEVLLVKSPEINYLPGTNLKDFYNPANTPARAYHLEIGDVFTITTDGITGTAVKDQYLVPANGSMKLAAAADLTGATRFAAVVIDASASFGYTGTGWAKQAAVTARVIKK